MALSEDKVEELMRPELKLLWEMKGENDCTDNFRADEHYNLSRETVVSNENSIK